MRRGRLLLAALSVKAAGLCIGVSALIVALGYAFDDLSFLAVQGRYDSGDVVAVLAMVGLALCGTALVFQLPESLAARFVKLRPTLPRKPVYGFGTVLAIGVGATLGSPLFILIPLNIEEYEFVSVLSLLIATLLSVAMAKVYANMYAESKGLGLEGVGGPSFTKLAWGGKSVRYFVARLSMWIANTALAAYAQIVFLLFDFEVMPGILTGYGVSESAATSATYVLGAGFLAWAIINVLFEQRFLKGIGSIQAILTAALVSILAYHSYLLGGAAGWNLGGLLTFPSGGDWVTALVVNTGYLYLLFFGFQEIQALEKDSVERSPIPIASWLKRGFTVARATYLGVAMVLSVIIASALNIVYGLAVFASHPDASALGSAHVPAVYLAQTVLGPGQGLLVGVAFLIATVTTFVPAFLAAARHLGALGEDGYMPISVAKLSWIFTLVAVLLLAIQGQDFLVKITDFMVLISLGIITFSGASLRSRAGTGGFGNKVLAFVVAASCFVLGAAIYQIDPSVVVFGTVAIIFGYVVFDIFELGSLGAQLFLSTFGTVCVAALGLFRHAIHTSGPVDSLTKLFGSEPNALLVWGLLATSTALAANVVLDVKVLKRTLVG